MNSLNRISQFKKSTGIIECFLKNVNKYPDKTAILHQEQTITYNELNILSNKIANFFLNQYQIKPKTCIAIHLHRSIELIATVLAICKLSAIYIPLPLNSPDEYKKKILTDSRASIIVTDTEILKNLGIDIVDLLNKKEEISRCCEKFEHVCNSPEDVAYITYTSGTTATPKGVIVPFRGILSLISNPNYVNITSSDVFLQLSPFEFDGSTFEIWGSLLNGATLSLMPPGYPTLRELRYQIEQNQITILFITTQLFNTMIDRELDSLVKVKQILFGGEIASISHVKKFLTKKKKNHSLTNIYGPTECTTFSTFYPINFLPGNLETIPIGKPITYSQTYIANENLKIVKKGEIGELLIGGDGVALGYQGNKKLTNEKFINNLFLDRSNKKLFRTGDFVKESEDGNLIFQGRKDRLVKIRGYRISLGIIENELLKNPLINAAAVSYLEDKFHNKSLYAWIKPNSDKIDKNDLKRQIMQQLPSYMIPNFIEFVGNIPIKPNGKINYKELVNMTNITKEKLVNLILETWKTELKLNDIEINDDIMDLGGHSLNFINILDVFHKTTNMPMLSQLKITDLFEYTTTDSLSNYVLKLAKQKK